MVNSSWGELPRPKKTPDAATARGTQAVRRKAVAMTADAFSRAGTARPRGKPLGGPMKRSEKQGENPWSFLGR
jgi:hypothetical protein